MFVQAEFTKANGKTQVRCYESWEQAEKAVRQAQRRGQKAKILPRDHKYFF